MLWQGNAVHLGGLPCAHVLGKGNGLVAKLKCRCRRGARARDPHRERDDEAGAPGVQAGAGRRGPGGPGAEEDADPLDGPRSRVPASDRLRAVAELALAATVLSSRYTLWQFTFLAVITVLVVPVYLIVILCCVVFIFSVDLSVLLQ